MATEFLGFSMYKRKEGIGIRLAPQTVKRVKEKLRGFTTRSHSQDKEALIQRINQYLTGWIGYYALAETSSIFQEIEGWIRRRMRMCLWIQWKRVRTRYRELRAVGLSEWQVHKLANVRKGPWRTAGGPLNFVLNNAYWQKQGLISLTVRYRETRNAWRTARCGTACRVV